MDSSVKSSSSGVTDSWLFVKNIVEDELNTGNNPENINHIKTTDDMEDSDGISVISESEMNKEQTSSDIEIEKGQIAEEVGQDVNFEAHDEAKNNQLDEEIVEPNLLTPPSTPNDITDEEQKQQIKTLEKYQEKEPDIFETAKCHKSSHSVLLLIGMSLIIAVLYTNVTSLKNELAKTVSVYEQRMMRLEEENQVLRNRLDELMRKLEEQSSSYTSKEVIDDILPIPQKSKVYQSDQDSPRYSPVTKDVWLGGEKEQVVKVLDKKYNSLPDYCYFTDEDDLFYEYNLENCEKKKQKMEERIRKLHDKKDKQLKDVDEMIKGTNSDKIYNSNDPTYKDYIAKVTDEILKSFDDEIEEIKSNRHAAIPKMDENINEQIIDKGKGNKQKTVDDSNIDKKYKKQQTKFDESASRDKKKAQQTKNYEGSGKEDKKPKDNKKRGKNQENNFDSDKPKNKEKRPKLTKQKEVNDWNERRSTGRDEARMKKENEENWYLKRKNDREIHRLA